VTQTLDDPVALRAAIGAAPRKGRRRIVGIVGAPASGKSTLAESLSEDLNAEGTNAAVVPMDGFHLDNRILKARNLLPRKGAPETFDVAGFRSLLARLRTEDEVICPSFDRTRDLSVACTDVIGPECDTLVVEGNYLMLDRPGWRDLAPLWDVTIHLDVPMETLRDRLIQRWLDHGLTRADATARAEANDLPNARLILGQSLPCDYAFSG
jgi:fructokinase